MTRNIFGCLMVAFLFTFALTVPAGATTISQPWGTDTSGVTKLEGFLMTSGATFGTTAFSGPPEGVLSQPNDQYAITTGGPWSSGTPYTITVDYPATSFMLDILEWNGASLQEQLHFVWNASNPDTYNSRLAYNGGLWSWNQPSGSFIDSALTSTPYNRGAEQIDGSAVPEPMTFILIGTGLIGLGLLRRRPKIAAIGK